MFKGRTDLQVEEVNLGFKYEIDKNKESNSFKSPRFVYQNSWTATVNNYLYYSPLVALK